MAGGRRAASIVIGAVAFVALSAGCSTEDPLRVHAPSTVHAGDARGVTVTGARPGAPVTITATVTYRSKTRKSRATFTADGSGTVDTASQAPTSGGYAGVVATGLLATMKGPGDNGGYLTDHGDEQVGYRATQDGRAAGRIEQTRTLTDDVTMRRSTVAADGLAATMVSPESSSDDATAVVVLGGSEGGEPIVQAAALAEQGHPALALGYFDEPGLPQALQDVPVETVGTALTYLAAQPGVDPDRIAVMGGSRGSELALLSAVHYPDQVAGVAVLSPSNLVNAGLPDGGTAWTWQGRPIPQGPIPIGRIRAPILAVCGTDDQLWQSWPASQAIVATDPDQDRLITERGAGHHIDGLVPDFPESTGSEDSAYGPIAVGGTVTTDGLGRVDAWAKTLAWLTQLPALAS